MHPGSIVTPGSDAFNDGLGIKGVMPMPDTLELPAATFLWLTARNAEFLSGRYVQYSWKAGPYTNSVREGLWLRRGT